MQVETSLPTRYENPFIQTFTGVVFPILEPTPDHIKIEDIAHSLSNVCRFAGHVREFYSVAQHSVLVSENVPAEFALEGLLHDGPEAYIVDIPRPLKYSGLIDNYKVIEDNVWITIARRFDLLMNLPKEVKDADTKMLMTEQRDLMGRQAKPWKDNTEPYDFTIRPLPPHAAKERFIARFNQLLRERNPYGQKKEAA